MLVQTIEESKIEVPVIDLNDKLCLGIREKRIHTR